MKIYQTGKHNIIIDHLQNYLSVPSLYMYLLRDIDFILFWNLDRDIVLKKGHQLSMIKFKEIEEWSGGLVRIMLLIFVFPFVVKPWAITLIVTFWPIVSLLIVKSFSTVLFHVFAHASTSIIYNFWQPFIVQYQKMSILVARNNIGTF
jgi:hypothetical protein